ncbi:MAG: hypothetical protein ACRCSW_12640, partial [Tabrizicola sp.]
VPMIFFTGTLSCLAEELAGTSGKNEVECTAKGPGIEPAQVIPDRGCDKILCVPGFDEDRMMRGPPSHLTKARQ